MNLVTASATQPFTLIRDGRQVVYNIQDAQIVLRRRRCCGVWTKYLVGYLDGVHFEASYGRATTTEVRQIRALYN